MAALIQLILFSVICHNLFDLSQQSDVLMLPLAEFINKTG